MSWKFFAEQVARIDGICRINQTDMFRIIEHGIDPVDRVGVARECRERMAWVLRTFSHYGPRRLRRAASEMHKLVQTALRTIEWLIRERFNECEAEWSVALETAEVVAEVIGQVVSTEILNIRQLQGLRVALGQFERRADYLSASDHYLYRRFDKGSIVTLCANAFGLAIRLDQTGFDIIYKIDKLRRDRRPREDVDVYA